MQSTSEGCLNIAELANQLRREKVFINSEKQLLQTLNEQVNRISLELLQCAWICTHQRQNLTDLITSRCEADSILATQRASALEGTTFIDAHKVFKYKEANALGELFGWLRDSPHLVALCLLLGEDHLPPSLPVSLMAGLYGSCRAPADNTRFLALIRSLIKHQLVPAPDPRKLFRTGKCALAQLYAVYRDNQPAARQFLAAALSGPVSTVMQEDEFFLDLHPDKALERFSPADRQKKFGQVNSAEYATKVSRYRKWTVQSLYNLTSQFVTSLKDNWVAFPANIAWIVQQIVHLLIKHSRTNERDLHALCTDLILNHFICPAIVNPEAHGVVELPVSYVARSNLIQIAQILQGLALINHQPVDPRARDLYSKFDRSIVSSLISAACNMCARCEPAPPPEQPPAPSPPPPALYTAAALAHTVNFLQRTSSKLNNNAPSVTSEEAGSSGVVAEAAGYSENMSDGSSSGSETCASNLAALLQSIEPNYRSRLHDLLRKLPDLNTPPPEKPEAPVENGLIKRSILAKVPKPRLPRSSSSLSQDDKQMNGDGQEKESVQSPEVLMIRLATLEEQDYVGLISEAKILECYYGGSEAGDADETGSALAVAGNSAPVQKRTRFSVSHDEVSLGNTSDNLEAVSEAASNHSVTSSLELETEDQNDNLSDMVSANVSGRGSPNISGYETPSSQVTDDAPPDNVRRLPPVAVSTNAATRAQKLLKQTRNDIEDKFCKFEIKKMLEGDETVSVMSDTWSTDVLASDSEGLPEHEPANNSGTAVNNAIAPDVSETASESAWSMDVLASDSDRNTEVDTDDCVSVAARSDTSSTRRVSQPEDTPTTVKRVDLNSPRHLPRANMPTRSNSYLSATAALSGGGELDVSGPGQSTQQEYMENRKSILVNGYPVMTCYAASTPESPSAAALPQPSNDVFDYEPSSSYSECTESTIDGGSSLATSQWVDENWTRAGLRQTDAHYGEIAFQSADPAARHFRRFETSVTEAQSSMSELVTRMSAASISTHNNSETRTSVVSISSSRVEKRITQPEASTSGVSHSSLSINSETCASDRSSSQDVTERRVSPPQTPAAKLSTGAIPKSISFDATAEKTQRRRILGEDMIASNLDELKNNVKRSGGTLLHKIKMFRHKTRHHTNGNGAMNMSSEHSPSTEPAGSTGETRADDILAKYRRRAAAADTRRPKPANTQDNANPEGVVDLNDPEVFNSMKRKLRVVLSDPDLHGFDFVPVRSNNTLTEWITAASCRATSLPSSAQAAACARALAAADCARLAAALRADLAARRPYAAYLASCRAALTHHTHMLQRQISEVRGASVSAARAAAAARALQQLERGGGLRRGRGRDLAGPDGELMDERASRLTATIKAITAEVKADPSWEGASSSLLEMAELTVERAVFARLYLHVLFPNGDGDIARDQVLSAHIRRISSVGASALGVPARHLWAAPYTRAADILRRLSLARSPRDKLACIMNCITAIMAILGLEMSAPAADDLTPVLIYVIIRVNPPSLLSTIELVNALGGPALSGEALYWWTQFCAAVAHIKTVD